MTEIKRYLTEIRNLSSLGPPIRVLGYCVKVENLYLYRCPFIQLQKKVQTRPLDRQLRGLLSPISSCGSYLESCSDGIGLKLFMVVEQA